MASDGQERVQEVRTKEGFMNGRLKSLMGAMALTIAFLVPITVEAWQDAPPPQTIQK